MGAEMRRRRRRRSSSSCGPAARRTSVDRGLETLKERKKNATFSLPMFIICAFFLSDLPWREERARHQDHTVEETCRGKKQERRE